MDRKAWIVVTLCAILLALSLRESSKNELALREKELEKEKKNTEQVEKALEDKPADLTVELPPVPESLGSEESHELATDTNVFTLSSLEGGIVKNELLEEKSVYGDSNITMNDLGLNRIGALTSLSGESLEKGYYKVSEGKKTEDSITFIGPIQKNLCKVLARLDNVDVRNFIRVPLDDF